MFGDNLGPTSSIRTDDEQLEASKLDTVGVVFTLKSSQVQFGS